MTLALVVLCCSLFVNVVLIVLAHHLLDRLGVTRRQRDICYAKLHQVQPHNLGIGGDA